MYADGTRRWKSKLSLKSNIELQKHQKELDGLPNFPILLEEEPESHLHPHAQKKNINQITSISSEMIITTHSSDVLSSVSDFQYSRLFKEEKETKLSIINDEVDSTIDFKIKSQIIPYKTELFFSDKVILVEGISDKIFIENYFLYKKNKRIVDVGVSVVDTGGFGSLGLFRKFCNYYNIVNIILSDLDAKAQVEQSIQKYNLDSNKIFYTFGDDLEDDILANNYDVILSMFVKEEKLKEQHIKHIIKTGKMRAKLEKYLKEGKTEYPFIVKKYFKDSFSVPVIDNIIIELEG
jgi:putative ATP-dependent endonuclease of OLD family